MSANRGRRPRPENGTTPPPAQTSLAAPPTKPPLIDAESAQLLHGPIAACTVYRNAITPRVAATFGDSDTLTRSAMDYFKGVLERMAPRDPTEEMLVAQLLLTHARVLHLTDLANRQTELDAIRVTHEYADRASNTFRRLMLALAEYRRPPTPSASFTAIRQANIANQQIVQNNGNLEAKNTTNEQGCELPSRAPALSADPGGTDFIEDLGRARDALGAEHGPADAGGQGSITLERGDAR